MRWLIESFVIWGVAAILLVTQTDAVSVIPHCEDLLIGHDKFLCGEPMINAKTQRAENCSDKTSLVKVTCHLAPNVSCLGLCDGLTESKSNCISEFKKNVKCEITNGHKFENALLLSIFLGMFGIDRFYLGYPAIGLLKFCTLGFMFLGQLVDMLLIAMQIVGPADGSDYVIDYYGAKLTRISNDSETVIF